MSSDNDDLAGFRNASLLNIAGESFKALRNPLCAFATLIALATLPGAVLGGNVNWEKYSKSYEVHLGVVSADTADRDNELRLMHAASPHGRAPRSAATRHVMIAVFSRADKSRIEDADMTAEVVETDLIHVKRERKTLDTSQLSAGTHYCNFFTLHWNGPYRINIRIHEPGKNAEEVTFDQEETGL